MLADMLVIERGGDAFWNEEARALLAGLLYFVMTEPEATRVLIPGGTPLPRDLLSVRRLLTLPPQAMEVFFDRLASGEGVAARAASRHLQKADKERSGVLSTALSHTHFLDAPAMERVLGSNDVAGGPCHGSVAVDPYGEVDGTLSLFLVLPPDRLATYRGWLRLMIASTLLVLTRNRPASRVLFLLDEFANLGRMDLLAQAVTLMAGYGATFWFFIQDLPRLRSVYPSDWETFLANCEALQAFGSRDPMTCQYLSRRTGQQTVFVRSDSQASASKGSPHSVSVSETGRALLLPDEVERMEEDEALLFVRGERPIRARKVVYYRDREFKPRGKPLFDGNPFFDTGP
ncbi:MAG: type IV secretory system conjugative DNA transfer family protein [Rhodothermales bacterium]|nr:type IV secretory system conjugative DNA transfer family protein [Rhodothermales bacterium]